MQSLQLGGGNGAILVLSNSSSIKMGYCNFFSLAFIEFGSVSSRNKNSIVKCRSSDSAIVILFLSSSAFL